MTGKNVLKGMIAGFVATVVLSALMMMKTMMGVMPELDVIAMLTKMMGASSNAVGWVAHFMIGTVVWGGLFAWIGPNLPGRSHWTKGIVFGTGAWLLMMVMVMPMTDAGFSGMKFGMMAPVMTLALHVIYGAVLGGIYGLERPQSTENVQASHRYYCKLAQCCRPFLCPRSEAVSCRSAAREVGRCLSSIAASTAQFAAPI